MSMNATGLYAAVMKPGQFERYVMAQAKTCLVDAFREWVTRGPSPTFRDSFGPGAYGRRWFSRRSKGYEKQQVRRFGAAMPYAQPRSPLNFARVAKALLRANAKSLLKAAQQLTQQEPMRTAVFKEGSGFRVAGGGSKTVTASLTLPGARVLNKGGSSAKMVTYRDQLLGYSLRPKGADVKWIYQRAQELMAERIWHAVFDQALKVVA